MSANLGPDSDTRATAEWRLRRTTAAELLSAAHELVRDARGTLGASVTSQEAAWIEGALSRLSLLNRALGGSGPWA